MKNIIMKAEKPVRGGEKMKRMIITIFIISLFVLVGCQQNPSEKVLHYEANNEIIGTEKDEIIGDVSDTIYESIDRSNSEAEEMMVGPVEREGEEVTPSKGRYTISGGLSGRVVISDEQGNLLLEEILDQAYGVQSVTVDLNGSHSVYFDGVEEAMISPAQTNFSNELSAGIWEVGKDIEAGDYSVMAASEQAFGDLMIFEEGESTRLYEIIDTSPESMIEVSLEDGQKVKISGLAFLEFKPKS
ncbi:hypothetical protein SAMN05216389_10131 [Oceanobacillus limi]|uniref:Uncharacterized protein n=2 Tax=Oceanobacillus limi TaxID=930131 RepID=A0A1H9XZM1_9BACI|nr:hypothetical protein SAMN05216389_10131 [Oceanobacillus limi]